MLAFQFSEDRLVFTSPKRQCLGVAPGPASVIAIHPDRIGANMILPHGLKPGHAARFLYPVCNRADMPLEYTWRRVVILGTRWLRSEPLESATIIQHPLVRRGRVLLKTFDLDCKADRDFYLEAIKGIGPLPHFQLGFFDRRRRRRFGCGPLFKPTAEDYLAMRDAIAEYRAEMADPLPKGVDVTIFPVGEQSWQRRSAS